MAFTVKDWKDRPFGPNAGETLADYEARLATYAAANPTLVTQVNAAAQEDMETRLSGYTDTQVATRAAASHTHPASDIASGTIATARLGSGTASATTYLRGDQTWATVSGGATAPPANFTPSDVGLLAWTYDHQNATAGSAPLGGNVILIRVPVRATTTFASVKMSIGAAGTGATPLANCFFGMYDAAGNLKGTSADQSTAWATAGVTSATLTAAAGQDLTVAAADNYCFVAVLVGTQSTTNVTFLRSANNAAQANLDLTPTSTPPSRWMQKSGTFTALPATITYSTCANIAPAYWAGLA